MSDVGSELVWLQRLLAVQCSSPLTMYVGNTSTIQIAANPVLHDRTKHIEIHVHYILDFVRDGVVRLKYVISEDQLADLFTKPFSRARHWFLSDKLMLRSSHHLGGGGVVSGFGFGQCGPCM
ncbi:unnamed protein product [Linum trigynum]|uniref:Uncharacterized protein n=1 Tax=Linum trigynum TaxID=586398 RepID=A0AAV2EYN2_9ROSI